MHLRDAIAVAIIVLAPTSTMGGSNVDPFVKEAAQQHEARRAAVQERQERVERWQERQRQREIDHPSIIDDDDDADDDLKATARRP